MPLLMQYRALLTQNRAHLAHVASLRIDAIQGSFDRNQGSLDMILYIGGHDKCDAQTHKIVSKNQGPFRWKREHCFKESRALLTESTDGGDRT